jgi:hypothetical protein
VLPNLAPPLNLRHVAVKLQLGGVVCRGMMRPLKQDDILKDRT